MNLCLLAIAALAILMSTNAQNVTTTCWCRCKSGSGGDSQTKISNCNSECTPSCQSKCGNGIEVESICTGGYQCKTFDEVLKSVACVETNGACKDTTNPCACNTALIGCVSTASCTVDSSTRMSCEQTCAAASADDKQKCSVGETTAAASLVATSALTVVLGVLARVL